MSQNILMISTDRKILEENNEARERMKDYGTIFDSLFILVVSKKRFWGVGKKVMISENVTVVPINFFRAWFISVPKDVNVLTAQDPFENGCIGMFLSWRKNIPIQLQIHTDLFSPYFAEESVLNCARVFIARMILPKANSIRVVSQRIKKSLIEKLNIPESKITVLPVFVDTEKIKSAPIVTDLHKKYPKHEKIILMASRLTREKNIPLALEAMSEIVKKFPKTLLLIVGEGPERENLKSQITKYKLNENVIIEPWTNDLSSYYKTADLFLLTSNYEGYGRTVVEAMIADCPVVMTDVGLARDILVDKFKVAILPVGNVDAFTQKISDSLSFYDKRKEVGYETAQTIKPFPVKTKYEYLQDFRKTFTSLPERKLKVLFAINDLGVGGAQNLVIDQISLINKDIFDPYIITIYKEPKNSLASRIYLSPDKFTRFNFRDLYDFKAWLILYKYLRKNKFDTVITNLFDTNVVVRLLSIFVRVSTIISYEHSIYSGKHLWQKTIDKVLSFFTYKIIVGSSQVRDFTSKQEYIPLDKFCLNHNGALLDFGTVREGRDAVLEKHGFPKEKMYVVAVGRLIKQKGHKYFIEAAKNIKDKGFNDLIFLISGEGELSEALKKQVLESGLSEYVFFIGLPSMKEVAAMTDIFVLPSLWEGLSIALIQSMNAGCPVIGTRVSGTEEVIQDGANGLLVEPGNVEQLERTIISVIEDKNLRTNLGIKAKERSRYFSIEKNINTIENLISSRSKTI